MTRRIKPRLIHGACAAALLCGSAFAGETTVKRDQWGVPHVYAENVYDLFYGYGYGYGRSVAQDRLYSMDIARRSTTGRLSEALGPDWIDFDRRIRAGYDPTSIRRQIEAMAPEDRDILAGYAAGVNARIEEVRADEAKLPKEYLDNDFRPEDWTGFDVAMVFIGSMLGRYGDFDTEIENVAFLQALEEKHGPETARRIFDTLLTLDEPDAPTTIPKGDWNPRAQEETNEPLLPVREGAARLPVRRLAVTDAVLEQAAPPGGRARFVERLLEDGPAAAGLQAASNVVVLDESKSEGANSILVNGPQFGYFTPAYTYSAGLHGAGFDIVGNTALAYPGVMFAHNGQIAWGSTWSAGDQVDMFELELHPEEPARYRQGDGWAEMEAREETIEVKGGEPVAFTAYSTPYGPVVARDEEAGVAYAKKRAWSGGEIDTLLAWVRQMKATSFDEYREALADSAVNVNHYYADAEGRAGYVVGGWYPKRAEGADGRLPTPGDGSLDWEGIQPPSTNPHVVEPSTGIVINWNNRPAEGWVPPDEWWYAWTPADRVTTLFDHFESQETFTPEEAWHGLVDVGSFEDVNLDAFLPILERATASLPEDDMRRRLADRLAAWDQRHVDEDRDGRFDAPESAIVATWLAEALSRAYGDDLPAPYDGFFSDPGYPDPRAPGGSGQNIPVGAKILHLSLLGRGYDFTNDEGDQLVLDALQATADRLSAEYGEDVGDWLAPVSVTRFQTENFLGAPQTSPDYARDVRPAMNRGTENNMIVLSEDGVASWEVVAPGQSGWTPPKTGAGSAAS